MNTGKPADWGLSFDYRITRHPRTNQPVLEVRSESALDWAHENMPDYGDRIDVWGFVLGKETNLDFLQWKLRSAGLIDEAEYVRWMEYEQLRQQHEAWAAEELA